MFALCWFLRRCPPEQGEPRVPVAIDGASAWHRETLHWRRRYYMFSIAVLALVVIEMLWCVAAVAQERPAKGKMSKEQELASVRALEKPAKKENRAEPPLQHGVSIQIQTEDIMKYLLENRGKVTLYSGMHGKFQVELGLFGYLGLKYQF